MHRVLGPLLSENERKVLPKDILVTWKKRDREIFPNLIWLWQHTLLRQTPSAQQEAKPLCPGCKI